MASLTAIGFYAASAVALLAAGLTVAARKPAHSLAGFALVAAAMIVPLVQLAATTVAALSLLAAGVALALLSGVEGLAGGRQGEGGGRRRGWSFWLPAGLGLAAFVWVLLATGSRQVVEALPPLERKAVGYGEGEAVLALLVGEHLVSATLVGLIALCCVIAAVLSLVGEGGVGIGEGDQGCP